MEVVGADRQRPHDKMGISVGYAHVSKALQALDLDYRRNGISGWTVQLSFQYIVHPGGGSSQVTPVRKLSNASVLGLRTVVKF